ncbi:hypothetical protein BC829DRAFT_369222 [Chytridium lagenaria]|nr:hypothetical protein BC829DRAFT_369222 [Chytridium lagenaria]
MNPSRSLYRLLGAVTNPSGSLIKSRTPIIPPFLSPILIIHDGPPSAAVEGNPAGVGPTTASKAKQLVNSFLHGSPSALDEHAELEANTTHSKLLARGKYVHKLQTHNVKPEAWDDYVGLVSEHYARISENPDFKVRLYGSWKTEIGPLDQALHIWEYNKYQGYDESTLQLSKDAMYQKFMKDLRPMLRSRESQIMLEFAFWEGSSPSFQDGIYELRTYRLKPGRMLEWEHEWKKGLEARRQFVQPVGAWFSQVGDLNYVHHLWAYPNLHVRKEMREASWQVDGWAKTVYNTVRMIDTMHCRIVRPLPSSPLK